MAPSEVSTYLLTTPSGGIEYTTFRGWLLLRKWRAIRGQPYHLVFISGLDDPFQNHIRLFRILQRSGFTVTSFNLPGHGRSTSPQPVTWENLSNLVLEMVDKLGLSSHKVILMGYSLGGAISLQVTAKRPAWLAGVKLIAPLCYPMSRHLIPGAWGLLRNLRQNMRLQKVDYNYLPIPLNGSYRYMVRHYLPLIQRYKLDLSQNQIPITVAVNGRDRLLNPILIKKILSAVPHCHLVELPQLSHSIYWVSAAQLRNLAKALMHGA